jgi:AraC family transcriptional regulator
MPARIRLRVFNPHEATVLHEHEHPYFCLIINGDNEQRAGTERRLRHPGQVFYYPAGEPQSERFGNEGGIVFSVDVPGIGMPLPARSRELRGRSALVARGLYATWARSRQVSPLTLDEAAIAVLGFVARDTSEDLRWASVAREYMHAHFHRTLSLTEIAAAANVHPVHLSRSFTRRFATSVGDYLRALRVDFAARRLAATGTAIADIALDAGFSSQSHLTRHFTRQLGVSPAAYRRVLSA